MGQKPQAQPAYTHGPPRPKKGWQQCLWVQTQNSHQLLCWLPCIHQRTQGKKVQKAWQTGPQPKVGSCIHACKNQVSGWDQGSDWLSQVTPSQLCTSMWICRGGVALQYQHPDYRVHTWKQGQIWPKTPTTKPVTPAWGRWARVQLQPASGYNLSHTTGRKTSPGRAGVWIRSRVATATQGASPSRDENNPAHTQGSGVCKPTRVGAPDW